MQFAQPTLIGAILERKPRSTPSAPSPHPGTSGQTGFPTVQHRSKSAFARAREQQKAGGSERHSNVPIIQSTGVRQPGPSVLARENPDDWRKQVEEENKKRVEAMTDEEREEERREILAKFGPNVADILRKARQARVSQEQGQRPDTVSREDIVPKPDASPKPDVSVRTEQRSADGSRPASPSSPRSAMSRPGSRPSSRADRNVRFAEITANDIYVYESAPPSPRRKALALPPPADSDGPTISLGEWKARTNPVRVRDTKPASAEDLDTAVDRIGQLEEGTPEDIRRRFFPTAPAHDPSLEWIESAPAPDPASAAESSTLRFDLTGTPIPPALSSTLPTHLGLHHHAEGAHAGYTLDDVFLLSRSTVPAQRATMLDVLSRIARKLGHNVKGDANKGIKELVGQEIEIRKRIIAAGVEAMAERGSLGARAIETLWECVVGWDEDIVSIEGIELHGTSKGDSSPTAGTSNAADDPISTLPLDYVLEQISTAIGTAALPRESLAQLLSILHRFAQHSNRIAESIVSTAGLVPNILQTFLLTPIPPSESSPLPDPFALQLLCTLALASRTNATALLGPADALLRFVITLPPSSPYSLPLASALLTGTLRLYAIFASYGLYAHIATTAAEHFAQMSRYVQSEECRSKQLREAWLGLLEAWMVCAQDPHCTTPSHEILWSQVVGWGWGEDVLEMRPSLSGNDVALWTALWRVEAAWLEGARVNGVRAGESERAGIISAVRDGFQCGVEKMVVEQSGAALTGLLLQVRGRGGCPVARADLAALRRAAEHAGALAAALRLWLSCLSPHQTGPPDSPPFMLPFAQISTLCAQLVDHPIWDSIYAPGSLPYALSFGRPLSSLLSCYLQLSRRLPGTLPDLWVAQAVTILGRLVPGDEEVAQRVVEETLDSVTPDFMASHQWGVPPIVWDRGGFSILKPFYARSLQPKDDAYVGPSWPTTRSISVATTQRLPPTTSIIPERLNLSLPLPRDWLFCPLDHLLRSGDSRVFKSLPLTWDASETEVVRATLMLVKTIQEVVRLHRLDSVLLNREETVFACMKVFMLEHGQQQNDSSEEVFRDNVVGRFMDDFVAPFVASASATTLLLPPPESTSQNLEKVGIRFLGSGTPFYQFYTDFVSLYDAISFSHPLFARLLLPPISMRYPPDYRKYLWADYGHLLKTIRTPVDAVITDNLGEFLWPVESDSQIMSAYLRALVKMPLDGFLRFVAIHHIACNVWADLRENDEDKAGKLLQAVVDQAGLDVIREVVCYRQAREGTLLIPPACFEQSGNWKTERLRFVERVGGAEMKERLGGLLKDK